MLFNTTSASKKDEGLGSKEKNFKLKTKKLMITVLHIFGTLNVGSLCGRKMEVCEELRKRKVDVCCIQEVRWKGQGARFVGASGRRYKMWWSGNDAGFGGVGILVKEKISGNVVEVRRKSDRVIVIVLTLGREVMRVICAYGPQSGRPDAEKVRFYDEMGSEWDLGS